MKQINPDLSRQQKDILFNQGTEAPYTDKLLTDFSDGQYACVNCGNKLFKSSAKYESTIPGLKGWPSFDQSIDGSIECKNDDSLGMKRTEVICSKCKGHLGHVFDANDAPSGTHFCISSVVLDFEKS